MCVAEGDSAGADVAVEAGAEDEPPQAPASVAAQMMAAIRTSGTGRDIPRRYCACWREAINPRPPHTRQTDVAGTVIRRNRARRDALRAP